MSDASALRTEETSSVSREPVRQVPRSVHSTWRANDATRHLCAAAYLDEGFRATVLKKVLQDQHRALAPEYGIDIEPIVTHCLNAQARELRYSAALAVILLVSAIAAVSATSAEARIAILIGTWIAGGIIVARRHHDVRYGSIRDDLSRENFSRRELPRISGDDAAVLNERARNSQFNVVAYSGFTPFVGSGALVESWSFAVNVTKGASQLTGERRIPQPFTVAEILDSVTKTIDALELSDVRIQDIAYVSGRDLQDDKVLLPDHYRCPSCRLPDEMLNDSADGSGTRMRTYRCIQSVSWDGELVVSMYLRFRKQGSNLFVELSTYLLPPLKEQYHAIDSYKRRASGQDIGGIALGSLFLAPFSYVAAPMRLWAAVEHKMFGKSRARREIEKAIDDDVMFDYGADSSLRSIAASDSYRRYFQRLDKEMHVKLLERQILEGLTEFLDSRDIDTAEIIGRRDTILNTGVIVSQSTIAGDNVVVGKSAKAKLRSVKSAVSPAAASQ